MAVHHVGVVGLSPLTAAAARRLASQRFVVSAYDPDPDKVAALAADGIGAARLPADAAEYAELVILDLPDGDVADEALFDLGGVAETLPAGGYLLDLSGGHPASGEAAGKRLANYGICRVEATLVGGPELAQAGRLQAVLGCNPEQARFLTPVLRVLAHSIVRLGPLSAAAARRRVVQASPAAA